MDRRPFIRGELSALRVQCVASVELVKIPVDGAICFLFVIGIGFMVKDNFYKQNKNFIGFVVFPIIPILVYLIDVVLGSILSDSIEKIYGFVGLLSREGSINFYNFEYPRTIFSLVILIAPLIVAHWFYCANVAKFDFSVGLGMRICAAFFPVVFLLVWVLILFLPMSVDENPTRKDLALYGIHRNPVVFMVLVYPILYLIFMTFGVSMRYFYQWKLRDGGGG